MTNNDEVFLNNKSGISIEEQKEILYAINKINEKNKKRLSQESGKKAQINAKKSGAFFPLAVNIGAFAALCAGALFLVSFNVKTDAQIRTGNAVYNLTEKALIEEIRKDTAEKIAAKDMEISSIASRLKEVDVQLSALAAGYFDGASEQLETRDRLMYLQNSYREELAFLQDERSQILENSRLREASIRAQLEERAREYSDAQQRTSTELDSAMVELERLSNEQERIAAIDAQLAGGLSNVGSYVQTGQYDLAAGTVSQLRDFLYNNSFASARSFQARRDFYFQSINLAQTMIDLNGGARNNSGAMQTELTEADSLYEQIIADMQKTIDSLTSGGSQQSALVTELENTVSTLRASVSSLESASADKDRTISSLETERADLTRTNQTQEQEIANLRNQLEIIRQALLDN